MDASSPAPRQDPFVKRCPVGCDAPLETVALTLAEGPLRRCSHCGQLLSSASADRYHETMEQFDASDFNAPHGPALQRRLNVATRRLDRIRDLLDQPGDKPRLLDVGCSRGQFVLAASLAGFAAEGVEPAPRIAAAARDSGLTVHTGLLEDLQFPASTFDAVTLFEVVEHLREPLPLLKECSRILRPGGILVISTGNAASWTAGVMAARWDYFDMGKDGGHISFFNPDSLALLAHRAGFHTRRIETARVKFHEKGGSSAGIYLAGKLLAEALNQPARWFGRGHDMLGYFSKPPD
jgi:2-polyprenyl-3-methyl-5-hydroxy-6-metoxy-1,4-benzoquinol methylase